MLAQSRSFRCLSSCSPCNGRLVLAVVEGSPFHHSYHVPFKNPVKTYKLDADLKQSSEAVDIKITASCFIMFILKDLKKSLCDNTFHIQKALDSVLRKVRHMTHLKSGTLLVGMFNKQ